MNKFPLKDFEKNGFCVIPNFFENEEIRKIDEAYSLMEKRQIDNGGAIFDHESAIFMTGDLLSQPEFKELNYLVFNNKILEISRKLLGETLVYFGESNMQSGIGLRGFHKDNRIIDRENSEGLDWKGNYPLIRMAIYLHDTDKYSGGVKIVPGSHKQATSFVKHGGVNLNTNKGDLVIWKLTTTHSGNAIRLKFFNDLSIHPKIEGHIPDFLVKKNPIRRRSIFIVFGSKSHHLTRYIEYFKSRDDNFSFLKSSRKSDDLIQLAENNKVDFVFPIKEYGENFNLEI